MEPLFLVVVIVRGGLAGGQDGLELGARQGPPSDGGGGGFERKPLGGGQLAFEAHVEGSAQPGNTGNAVLVDDAFHGITEWETDTGLLLDGQLPEVLQLHYYWFLRGGIS